MWSVLFWAETVYRSLKLTGKSNSSYISYLHSDIFRHLGPQVKGDHRPDSGNSDSSVQPVKKRRPHVGRRKGDRNT